MKLSKLKKEFISPSVEYRSIPFWSWNDKLSKEELLRQVNDMKKHGMGGFFMHSREGLETEYMGEEWISCIKSVVEEANRVGMRAWLYDEDRWPSGFAGGLVTKNGPQYYIKGLTVETLAHVPENIKFDVDEKGKIIAIFCVSLDKDKKKMLSYRQVFAKSELSPLKENQCVVIFREECSQNSDWYNGYAYSDNLSFECVQKFIETTYEAYYKAVGKYFGSKNTVPGIFTDEPNICDFRPTWQAPISFPWTTQFPQYFKDKRGYDIVAFLPYLFFDGDKTLYIRHDYYRTLGELFADAYSKQLSEWCEKHKIAFTGHYLAENDLWSQVQTAGDIMLQYSYQQQPGIDILTESINEVATVKQCSSVAHQFGRKFVLSELYGCTGWEFSFEGQKYVGDWQYALGVNLRCQHLALYTLRGCRKRDYPPSFNYQANWWEQNKVVEDYFARLSLMLSTGEPIREILVIHPISTAWCYHDPRGASFTPELELYESSYQSVLRHLLAAHYDYDLGDEIIIERHGKVSGKTFYIGCAGYKLIILPPMVTLLKNTIKLLLKFVDNGGKIIAIKPIPELIEGRKDNENGNLLKQLFTHKNVSIINDIKSLSRSIENILERRVSIIEPTAGYEIPSILYQEREVKEEDNKYRIIFFANTDREKSYNAIIRIKGGKYNVVEEYDLLRGKYEVIPVQFCDGYIEIKTQFSPVASRLFVVAEEQAKKIAISTPKQQYREISTLYLGPVYKFSRTTLNTLPLDFCRYKMCKNTSSWSEEMPIWQAQREIRNKLGLRQIFMNGGVQRWVWVNKPVSMKDKNEIELELKFKVKDKPSTPIFFIIEGAKQFTITLNNNIISNEPAGWFIDRSFDKIKLPSEQVAVGENTVILKCNYQNETELEECYIAGDFAVDHITKEIISEPETLRIGNWALQGYPFYGGNIIYETNVKLNFTEKDKIYFILGKVKATTASIVVNSSDEIPIPWRSANTVDITPFVKNGDNRIKIIVYGSLKNLLGPLHDIRYKTPWTGCGEFRTEGDLFSKEYILFPWGLMEHCEIKIYRKE